MKFCLRNKRLIAMMVSLSVMLSMTFSDVVVAFAEADASAGTAEAVGEEPTAEAGTSEEPTAEEIQGYEDAVNGAVGEAGAQLEAAELAEGEKVLPALVDALKPTWIYSGYGYANLRAIAQSPANDFNVMQGGCCDGVQYAYFTFMQKGTDACKIVKMELIRNDLAPAATEFRYVSCTPVLAYVAHGNDLAYIKDPLGDGKDKILVVSEEDLGEKTNYVTVIDVETMTQQCGRRIQYWNDLSEHTGDGYSPDYSGVKDRTAESLISDHHGFSCIAYDEVSGLIATTMKTDRDLAIFRPVWNAEDGTVDFKLQKYIRQNKINATLQGIDCDENYIYTTWSAKSGVLNKNIIQIYDWNGNKIGDRDVTSAYEIENLFHMGTGNNATYYCTFHHSYTHKYKAKQAYKVKWKKVWKKVKWKQVKWKKVKIVVDGVTKKVWKYKWKYKKKKVWKYKTKYKTVTITEIYRDAYAMSLGNMTVPVEDPVE